MRLEQTRRPRFGALRMLWAKRLARDGLLLTTAEAIEILGAAQVGEDPRLAEATLRSAGVPVDLLRFFHEPQESPEFSVIHEVVARFSRGDSSHSVRKFLDSLAFRFQPSQPGFVVSTENGEGSLDAVRMQLTRGDYWDGKGDGGNVDLARQLCDSLPGVRFLANIERSQISTLLGTIHEWTNPDRLNLTIMPVDFRLAQWAQDNAKTGCIRDASSGTQEAAALAPRFASRGEDGSTFVPGESLVLAGVGGSGHEDFPIPSAVSGR